MNNTDTSLTKVTNKSFFGCFGVIVILLIIIFFDWGLLKSEITAYPINCPSDLDYCYSLRYTRYKIDKRNQEVIYWTEGFLPEKLTNCAIVNRSNWSCKYNDGSAEFGFTNGTYYNYSLITDNLEELTKDIRYVSRIEYYYIQFFN